ncbi:alpha/beta hydrolase [Thiolinea disciformis]|uniref:alpha/beta hydrolase n=1 Tax=Thiolinea disciformis TaxID=125614 RepID=UPI000367723D|nr:alpha/beta fold hydrolase [Thiolinea disciformis]
MISISQHKIRVVQKLPWRWFKVVFHLSFILGVLILGFSFWLHHQIFSPPRRALQAYQQAYLDNPEQFGLTIRSYNCLAGQVPCLLVEPKPNATLSQRAQRIREQVKQRGVKLLPYGETRATLVLLHGRNGRKENLLPVAERFAALGFRCLVADLPSHGESPLPAMSFGASDFERSLPRHLVLEARAHFHLPNDPNFLWGLSMGGAFAVSAARENEAFWKGMIIVNSFADLATVMQLQVSEAWRTEARWLYPFLNVAQRLSAQPSIPQIRPADWAKEVTLPALVLHGTQDRFVPLEQGQQLYRAFASQDKQWSSVQDGGHNSVLTTPQPVYAEMGVWLLQHLTE